MHELKWKKGAISHTSSLALTLPIHKATVKTDRMKIFMMKWLEKEERTGRKENK